MSTNIVRIALTGGPSSGKSEVLELLRRRHPDMTMEGYTLVVVPESATECINAGLRPDKLDRITFQRLVLENLLVKETLFMRYAEQACPCTSRGVAMIFDRGARDVEAYLNPGELDALLKEMGIRSLNQLSFQRYDYVLFLHSIATAFPQLFGNKNNAARHERSAEDAVKLNERTLAAWKDHPYLYDFGNEDSCLTKYEKVCHQIAEILRNHGRSVSG